MNSRQANDRADQMYDCALATAQLECPLLFGPYPVSRYGPLAAEWDAQAARYRAAVDAAIAAREKAYAASALSLAGSSFRRESDHSHRPPAGSSRDRRSAMTILYTTLGDIAGRCQTCSAIDLWDCATGSMEPPQKNIDTIPAMLCGEGDEFTEFAIGHDAGAATFTSLGDPIYWPDQHRADAHDADQL